MGSLSCSYLASCDWDEPTRLQPCGNAAAFPDRDCQSPHLFPHRRCSARLQSSRGRRLFRARPREEQMFLLCVYGSARKAQWDNHGLMRPPASPWLSICSPVPRVHDSNSPAAFQRTLLGIMTALKKHCTSVSQGESSGL